VWEDRGPVATFVDELCACVAAAAATWRRRVVIHHRVDAVQHLLHLTRRHPVKVLPHNTHTQQQQLAPSEMDSSSNLGARRRLVLTRSSQYDAAGVLDGARQRNNVTRCDGTDNRHASMWPIMCKHDVIQKAEVRDVYPPYLFHYCYVCTSFRLILYFCFIDF